MLIGEYRPSIDQKGRVNFPSKLREDLGDSFIVTRTLGDKCLSVYSLTEWKKFEEKMASYPVAVTKALQRLVFAGATCIEPDKQGRILIPGHLRTYAELGVGEIVVIGVSNRCEIWSTDNWDATASELSNEDVNKILLDLGI